MISIESHQRIDSVTILFDDEGIDEMISFLNFIRKNDDSMHLNAGNELEETPLTQGEYYSIPHAKIIFLKQNDLP